MSLVRRVNEHEINRLETDLYEMDHRIELERKNYLLDCEKARVDEASCRRIWEEANAKREELLKRIERTHQKIRENELDLENLEKRAEEDVMRIRDRNLELEEENTKRRKRARENLDLVQHKETSLTRDLEEVRRRTKEIEKESSEVSSLIFSEQEKIVFLEKQLADLQREPSLESNDIEKLEKDLKKKNSEIEELKAKQNEEEKKVREIEKDSEQVGDERRRLNQEFKTKTERLRKRMDYLARQADEIEEEAENSIERLAKESQNLQRNLEHFRRDCFILGQNRGKLKKRDHDNIMRLLHSLRDLETLQLRRMKKQFLVENEVCKQAHVRLQNRRRLRKFLRTQSVSKEDREKLVKITKFPPVCYWSSPESSEIEEFK